MIIRNGSSISIRSSDYSVSNLVELCNYARYHVNGTVEIKLDKSLSTGELDRLSSAGQDKLKLIFDNELDNPNDEEDGCKHEYIEPIEDGVYIVAKGILPRRKAVWQWEQNPKECDVMVSYHGHNWIVAKEDLKGEELPLFSDDPYPEDTSSFYKCEIEALNDFDMKSCTEHLRKTGIAFKLDADLYIPTAGQLAAMYLFRKELNKALEVVGGTQMKEEIYWSSSEYNLWYSWYVHFDSGVAVSWNVKFNGYCVRPCMAFELKKK